MTSPRGPNEPQNFFKPVTANHEKQSIFKSLLTSAAPLQIKVEGAEMSELTVAKTVRVDDKISMVAKHVSGPLLIAPSNLTIVFEIGKSYFFCAATLQSEESKLYTIYLRKLYELQRRNSFRVSISQQMIRAQFVVNFVNGNPLSRTILIADLSAGGMSLVSTAEAAAFLRPGVTLEGNLAVGGHAVIPIKALCRHQRKTGQGKNILVQTGCQFVDLAAKETQSIAFLVNDCHRITFARVSRQ